MRNAVAVAGDVDLIGVDIGLLCMDLEDAQKYNGKEVFHVNRFYSLTVLGTICLLFSSGID